jgi:outer membrane protein
MNNLTIKKSLIPCLTMAAITLVGASLSSASFANDIAHTIRNSTEDNSTTENYFELGLGLAAGVGYKAYESEKWSLDIVMGPKFGGLHSHKKLEQLNDRNSSTMFGGRLTGTLGDNIVQFSLKHDISGNSHGTSVSALVGRNWQVRNWNFHGLVGLSFFDSRINNYYYGINEDEASRTQFTEYRPGSNVNFSAEAGVTYPITENWVFRSTARFGTVSDADTDSPIFETTRSTAMSLRSSLTYVF